METVTHRIEWWATVSPPFQRPPQRSLHRKCFIENADEVLHSSLIALSLILALLQFKPAPMYILDEVDAALDLSHTQNIGRSIKTRFKGSQFIVVSLKDGMFQNANRIFKTRFQEGTSVVQALTPADLR